jgi:squalene-associated FAD-dependent desaturase
MSYDAVILGGGFAGLSAATALVDRGARVLVLESRPVLGGRASVVRDPITGERLDNGQHVLVGCYDETFAFLRRIGTGDRVWRQAGLSVPMIEKSGRQSTLTLPPLPAPLHLLAGVLAWEALDWRERWSVLRVGKAVAGRADVSTMDGTGTVRDWLVACGQAPRLIELLWEPLALAALNQSIDEAASGPFVETLGRMFGPEPDDAALVVPAAPLDELYAEPARAWLEARGSLVRTNARARVLTDGGRTTGVEVRGETILAPTVIAAVPWFALPSLFDIPPSELRPLLADAAATAASPIVTVNLWFDRRVMDGLLVGLPGRRFQWVFDKAAVFGRPRSHLSLVSSGAAPVVAQSNDELVEAALREVREALPRARHAELDHAIAVRERQATFSLAPGQPRRPGTATAIEGLLLAGDWIATGLPATIESAVVSGHWAAAAARP